MPLSWVDLADVREYAKGHMAKAPPENLKPHWDTLLIRALTTGYWTIVSAFAARGFTVAQIDQWDRGAEFMRDIAAWFVLKRVSVIHPDILGQNNLDGLDRRDELNGDPKNDIPPAVLTIDGVIQTPLGTYGQINVGAFDTSEDMIVMPTSERDTRIGELVRF